MKKALITLLLITIYHPFCFAKTEKIIDKNNEFGGSTKQIIYRSEDIEYKSFSQVSMYMDSKNKVRKQVSFSSPEKTKKTGELKQLIETDKSGNIIRQTTDYNQKTTDTTGIYKVVMDFYKDNTYSETYFYKGNVSKDTQLEKTCTVFKGKNRIKIKETAYPRKEFTDWMHVTKVEYSYPEKDKIIVTTTFQKESKKDAFTDTFVTQKEIMLDGRTFFKFTIYNKNNKEIKTLYATGILTKHWAYHYENKKQKVYYYKGNITKVERIIEDNPHYNKIVIPYSGGFPFSGQDYYKNDQQVFFYSDTNKWEPIRQISEEELSPEEKELINAADEEFIDL